jgi:C4-type Zn-finger protein
MNEIKTKNGSILVPVITGRYAKCPICQNLLNSGEIAYSERIPLADRWVLKPPICKRCASEMVDSP